MLKNLDTSLYSRKNMDRWVGFETSGPRAPVTYLAEHSPPGLSENVFENRTILRAFEISEHMQMFQKTLHKCAKAVSS